MAEISVHKNKEPWLAASLSWLLPGIGHIYSGAYGLGTFFLSIFCLIYIVWIICYISTWTIIIPSIILKLSMFILLPIYASWSAFKLTKRQNAEDLAGERIANKDPWLAVFLSLVLPGLGHFYLRKWIVGVLSFLGLFVVTYIFHLKNIDFMIAIHIYRVVVTIHAYIACQPHRVKLTKPLTWFLTVAILVFILKVFILPQLRDQFFNLFEPVDGPSMLPTLVERDNVVVNRFTYKFNHPKPGDVIMFHPPEYVSVKKIVICKRIVAVGGETIEIRDGNVYVDGQERKFSFQKNNDEYSIPISTLEKNLKLLYRTFGINEPYHVPEGHCFVLGDNRQNSDDSRRYGPIPREKIIGKVVKIYWPIRRMGFVR